MILAFSDLVLIHRSVGYRPRKTLSQTFSKRIRVVPRKLTTATKLPLYMEEWKRYDACNKCIADFEGHSLTMGLHLSNPSSGFDAG